MFTCDRNILSSKEGIFNLYHMQILVELMTIIL